MTLSYWKALEICYFSVCLAAGIFLLAYLKNDNIAVMIAAIIFVGVSSPRLCYILYSLVKARKETEYRSRYEQFPETVVVYE